MTDERTCPEKGQSFSDFNLKKDLLKSIAHAGFEKPSPIQSEGIPKVLAGRDMIGQAQTGSGKTAAFVIPALEKLVFDGSPEVLVLVPTRELCKQVVLEFNRLGKGLPVKTVAVVGGESSYRQRDAVNRGASVIVATPGRLLDHLTSGSFKKFSPSMVILDEADEMLDMGFIDDIREILAFTPDERQTLLFSATMPGPIAKLANEQLSDPYHVKLVSKESTHGDIEQQIYIIRASERAHALIRLMDHENPQKAVVFCRTKRDTSDLCDRLNRAHITAKALHGDLSQEDRNRAITDIKSGHVRVLVATDVASRGLDISDLSHVFNFQVAENKERYTHRIGRTGRAGNKGKAITLLTPSEYKSQHHLRKNEAVSLKEIPSRMEAQTAREMSFLTKIEKIEASSEAVRICQELIGQEGAMAFLEKLYTFIAEENRVKGPELLGLSLKEAEKLTRQIKSGRSRPARGSSRPRGRGPGSFNGPKGSFRKSGGARSSKKNKARA